MRDSQLAAFNLARYKPQTGAGMIEQETMKPGKDMPCSWFHGFLLQPPQA
jgi:hypothetical protein